MFQFRCKNSLDFMYTLLEKKALCHLHTKFINHIREMNMHECGQLNGHNKNYLVYRIRKTCDKHNVSFLKYVFNENYASHVRQNMLRMSHDGLSDSVRQCIISHDPYDRVPTFTHAAESILMVSCMYYVTIVLFGLKAIHILLLLLIKTMNNNGPRTDPWGTPYQYHGNPK